MDEVFYKCTVEIPLGTLIYILQTSHLIKHSNLYLHKARSEEPEYSDFVNQRYFNNRLFFTKRHFKTTILRRWRQFDWKRLKIRIPDYLQSD